MGAPLLLVAAGMVGTGMLASVAGGSLGLTQRIKAKVLEDVLAWIDCDIENVVEAGDHWFVMGRVRELEVETDHGPMLFFRGKLGGFAGT